VNRGVALVNTVDNLVTFLNASVDAQISKCTYVASGSPHNVITATYKTIGVVGNAFTLAGSSSPNSFATVVAMSGGKEYEVNISPSLAATLAALKSFLNGSVDTNLAASTYDVSGTFVLTVQAAATGTGGNAITLGDLTGSVGLQHVTPPLNQVTLGLDLNVTLINLLAFLQDSLDAQISLCTYQLNQGTIVISSIAQNDEANGFTLQTTVTGLSLSAGTLTGGRDAGIPSTLATTASIAFGANPVCAMMTPVLDILIGHGIIESAGSSYIADLNWRDTLNSQRLITLSGGVKVIDPISGAVIVMPLAPRVAGVLIARDLATGYPFHSAANQPIQGIVSPARTIAFSLTDGSVEGQQLLAANMGIVVRGLVGVETAISSGGFILIATDNCGDDPLWQMYFI
jgi:hypothetical protein